MSHDWPEDDEERLEDDERQPGWMARVADSALAPLRILRGAAGFCRAWLFSRPLAALPWAAPAVLCAAALLLTAWGGLRARADRHRIAARYATLLRQSLEQGRVDVAELAARKLAYLDPRDPAGRFGLALALERRGRLEEARRMMEALAPADGAGYAPAHMWLARDLMRRGQPVSAADRNRCERHLRLAVEQEPDNAAARELLGRWCLNMGRYAEAAEHLAVAAEQQPELWLTVAAAHALRHDAAASQSAARKARDHLEPLAKRRPNSVELWIQWATAEMRLGEFARAETILLDALEHTGDDRCNAALADLYARQYDQLKTAGADAAVLLELVEKGLRRRPAHAGLLTRLAELSGQEGPEAERAAAAVRKVLARGEVPPTAHLVLGTQASQRGDYQQAQLHLEQAYRMMPQTVPVLNNLAWVLAHTDPPQWERALKLADQAVRLAPQHPETRHTRGWILLQMGRPKEALADLEAALKDKQGDPELHGLLAELYEELGDAAMAREHRRLAEAVGDGPP